MSHFYGIISDSARKNAPTARAHNGLTVEAQSFQGKIVTTLTREEDSDGHWVDYYEVWRKPHQGSGGESMLLAKGRIDQPTDAIIDRFAGQLSTYHGAGAQPALEFLEQNEIKTKTKRHKRQATGASNKQATSGKK